MTYQELMPEIQHLTLNERLLLLELLTRSVREELNAVIAHEQFEPQKGASSLDRVLGILKPDGPMPTDEDLKEDYVNYLIRKYA